MTRKRFKKLLMACGIQRNKAELAARLVRIRDMAVRARGETRGVYNGKEYSCTGYAFSLARAGGHSTCEAAAIAEEKRLVVV